MERLTKYLASGAADYNYPAGCYSGNDCNDRVAKSAYRQTCVERLAAYEDTGLTPERCAEFARADAEGRYIVMRDAEQEGVARLRELAEADKDGRVVVLPCKMGDTLFRVFDGNISEHEVQNMKYFARQGRLGIDMTPFFPDAGRYIGKTVFLTREEAEKALEAMDNG